MADHLADRYRVIARKGGKIVRNVPAPSGHTAMTVFDLVARANAEASAYDNVELQVMRVGEARYAPLLQAVGDRVITW